MFVRLLATSTLLAAACFQSSSALKWDPDEFVQEECAVVHPDRSINMTWLTSQDHWYFHAFSKSTLFEGLHYITTPDEFASLTDEELQKSCFMITQIAPEPKMVRAYGLNRTFFEFEASFPKYRKGVFDFALTNAGPPQYVATTYVVLTDNKSYFVGIDIYEDGAKGFFVASPLTVLPSEDMDKIKQFLDTHKFPKEAFYPLHTDCEHDEFLNNIKKQLNLS